jgi:O-antigen biosynthesis protein
MSVKINENEAYAFSVEQPVDWNLKPDTFWITGWFIAKQGKNCTDVRAFIDDVPFMGLFGLPRPDVEARYSEWLQGRSAGFAFRLDPWRGARLIRLEILNQDKEWVEFWRVPITVKGRGPARRVRPTLHPKLLKPLLLTLLKQPTLWPKLARPSFARQLVQEYSVIPLEALPVPPLYGFFEGPRLIANTQYHKLHVGGWAFHAQQPIRRLVATIDNVTQNILIHGLPRDDVARLFPGVELARAPLFRGDIDIAADLTSPVSIKVFAELENGEKLLCFNTRIHPWTSIEKEHPLPPYEFRNFLDIVRTVRRAGREYKVRAGGFSFWRTVFAVHRIYRNESQEKLPWFAWQERDAYQTLLARNASTPGLRTAFVRLASDLELRGGPDFVLAVDVGAADPLRLERLVSSVRAQHYPRWRLVLVQPRDASPEAAATLKRLAAGDSRLVVQISSETSGPAALNAAVQSAPGDWLAFLEPGARLAEDALLSVAEAIATEPALELVFTDEDRMTDAGQRRDPVFKGAWDRALVLSGHQPGNLLVIRRPLFNRANGLAADFGPAALFDLQLRLEENVSPNHVKHLETVGYHGPWPAPEFEPGSPMLECMRQALDVALRRRGWPANAFHPSFARQLKSSHHQIFWESSALAQNPVTIVIPTRDRCDLLERCLEYLLLTIDWRHVKLIIVDDFSRDERTLRLFERLQRRRELSCRVVRPATDPAKPFNYSLLMNTALPLVDTPLILHLNNDVDALRSGWIEAMAGWFASPDVGAVGARLIYPDNRINHAGITVGPHDGLADTPLAGLNPGSDDFFVMHKLARDVAAVTGACMMTRTALYRQLGGFDEAQFGVSYNDVDYCLRLGAAGYRVVYAPQAELRHWGSASRGTAYFEGEHLAFVRRYPGYVDAHFPARLRPGPGTLELDTERYEHAKRAGALHLLLVTHNLNFEGAPLFLLEYANFMVTREGFKIDLVSAEDGPLRAAYEAAGITVTLVDRHLLHGARDEQEFAREIRAVLAKLDLSAVDVVLCNTVACWWGVHLAAVAGKPSLLYVHESATIKRFFSAALRQDMHGLARAAFRQATRVCFLCHATRAYYEELNDYDNFRLVSSWIDLPRIEAFKRTHTRAGLRRQHGYADDEIIIANIGTVCARKGQHVFIRAIDHFLRHFAGPDRYRFLLVGGRAGDFLNGLERDIGLLGLRNVEIITETQEVYDFFLLADMFVCTSFEESFPRVLLEAMAFETPAVSTDVHGVVEMVTDRAEAYLLEPGDPVELSRIMKTCLEKERNGISTTPMGYSKVVRAYDRDRVLPRHADMAREAFLAFDGNVHRTDPHRLTGRGDRFESSW